MTDHLTVEPSGGAAYRGFLFSDLRGFAAFVERHGNAAAAEMVGRFLAIARDEVARHDGAEIKTEGDLIHAVFPSASSAVMCGLAIVDAAAAASADRPDRPITVGVGVHAGEAVETADGYIGTAVNLAARLCAAAGPGEVLVSATVRGITQASIPVGFLPRGRRRLKGIGEPVEVFAATRDQTATARRGVPNMAVLGAAAVAILAIVVLAVFLGSQLLANPAESPPVQNLPSPQPIILGAMPVGTYATEGFQPRFTFAIDDPGWAVYRDLPDAIGMVREVDPRGYLDVLRVGAVFDNPCVVGGEGTQTGPASDVIGAVRRVPHLLLGDPSPIEVGGSSGESFEVTVDEAALAACGGLAGGDVAVFGVGDETWGATPGERFRLVVVDVGGEVVTFAVSPYDPETQSVAEMEDFLARGDRVIQSVEFDGR